jgi:hypothetical protein
MLHSLITGLVFLMAVAAGYVVLVLGCDFFDTTTAPKPRQPMLRRGRVHFWVAALAAFCLVAWNVRGPLQLPLAVIAAALAGGAIAWHTHRTISRPKAAAAE